MPGIAQGISIVISLIQLAAEASAAAVELNKLIDNARAEGRDLTDAELDQLRAGVTAARDRLSQTQSPPAP